MSNTCRMCNEKIDEKIVTQHYRIGALGIVSNEAPHTATIILINNK